MYEGTISILIIISFVGHSRRDVELLCVVSSTTRRHFRGPTNFLPFTIFYVQPLCSQKAVCSSETTNHSYTTTMTMCIIRQLMYEHSIIDCYPRLLLDDEASVASGNSTVPDACESSVSSHDTSTKSFRLTQPRYRSTPPQPTHHRPPLHPTRSNDQKNNQDVMIFQKIAYALPPNSLLHLLHGAQTTHRQREDIHWTLSEHGARPGRRRRSRVRFSSDQKNQVHGPLTVQVHRIAHCVDPALWWQAEEYSNIRLGCRTLVEHYRLYQEDYVKAVKNIMAAGNAVPNSKDNSDTESLASDSQRSSSTKSVSKKKINKAMETLVRHTICRGFEGQIVNDCRMACKEHTRNVLKAQAAANHWAEQGRPHETIRRAARQTSAASCRLAWQLAQTDAFQARGVTWNQTKVPQFL